jgi:hypothetical protein
MNSTQMQKFLRLTRSKLGTIYWFASKSKRVKNQCLKARKELLQLQRYLCQKER